MKMNFVLEQIVAPAIEPITLAEAKRHIKQFVNVTSEDDDIEALIQVAREWVESYTGRAMIDQTWRLSVGSCAAQASSDSVSSSSQSATYVTGAAKWMGGGILLRRSPVLEILSVETRTSDREWEAVDTSGYELREAQSKYPRVVDLSGSWSSGDFRISYRAGFADRTGSPVTGAEVVPAVLKHAMKLILAGFDENRSPIIVGTIVSEMPQNVAWLLQSQKCELGMA